MFDSIFGSPICRLVLLWAVVRFGLSWVWGVDIAYVVDVLLSKLVNAQQQQEDRPTPYPVPEPTFFSNQTDFEDDYTEFEPLLLTHLQ